MSHKLESFDSLIDTIAHLGFLIQARREIKSTSQSGYMEGTFTIKNNTKKEIMVYQTKIRINGQNFIIHSKDTPLDSGKQIEIQYKVEFPLLQSKFKLSGSTLFDASRNSLCDASFILFQRQFSKFVMI